VDTGLLNQHTGSWDRAALGSLGQGSASVTEVGMGTPCALTLRAKISLRALPGSCCATVEVETGRDQEFGELSFPLSHQPSCALHVAHIQVWSYRQPVKTEHYLSAFLTCELLHLNNQSIFPIIPCQLFMGMNGRVLSPQELMTPQREAAALHFRGSPEHTVQGESGSCAVSLLQ
jgi:hypothetical protein